MNLLEELALKIFKDGAADKRNMDKCLVSDEDLLEQVRLKAQTDSPEHIKEVYMECNGEMSAVKKEDHTTLFVKRKL